MDYRIFGENFPFEKLKNARILITGANGMIASRLVEVLLEVSKEKELGIDIYAMCRNKENASKRFNVFFGRSDFHLMIQDVSLPLDTDVEFSHIIHAASSAHPGAFNTVPVDIMRANFIGTMNMLEYTRKKTDTRMLFVSSSEVYGENEERVPVFTEDMRGSVNFSRFRACYPESKRASETLCMSYKKQYGSDVVVVRPAFIYGRNILDSNTRADVYFLRQVLNKEDIVMYSKGEQIRSYCYVDDCVSGILYVLLLGESGEAYNIGNEDCIVSLWDYAQALADIGGVQLRYEPEEIPKGKVFLKTTQLVLSTEKLRKLGWEPVYGLEDGIKAILTQSGLEKSGAFRNG